VSAARRVRQLLAKLTRARDILQLGAYQPGSDPELDLALRLQAQLTALLQQDMHERATLDASRRALHALAGS
jgi:flagellum-specific ATP synthase